MEASGSSREWESIEQSERFERLTSKRRRIVSILLAVFVVWYGAFLICAAYARDFMAKSIHDGFTVAYAFALSLIVMTWAVGWTYVRTARTQLDPDREEILRRHDEGLS